MDFHDVEDVRRFRLPLRNMQQFTSCAFFAGATAGILSLIFGILALVPYSPFLQRETTLGVVLIVFGVTGIATSAGFYSHRKELPGDLVVATGMFYEDWERWRGGDPVDCSSACCTVWAFYGGATAGILSLIFGILALVPCSPFLQRETILGVVLIELGVTGIATFAGTVMCGISGLCIGFSMDLISSHVIQNGFHFERRRAEV